MTSLIEIPENLALISYPSVFNQVLAIALILYQARQIPGND